MKVKIIQCSVSHYWYKDYVDKIIDVSSTSEKILFDDGISFEKTKIIYPLNNSYNKFIPFDILTHGYFILLKDVRILREEKLERICKNI